MHGISFHGHFVTKNLFLVLYCKFPNVGYFAGVFVVAGALSLYIGNVHAGRTLHAAVLGNIARSPMTFFDTTPIGRIMNRFSKDIDTIDVTIAHNFQMWISCFLRVITVPIIVGMSTPLFLTTIVPLFIFYLIVQVGGEWSFV